MTKAAASVGMGARLNNLLFGSPSFARANGMSEAGPVLGLIRGGAWLRRCAATPVFAVDDRSRTRGGLPRVWVTEPAYDARRGRIEGRALVESYPNGDDPNGRRALRLAQTYFSEALTYAAESDRVTRRDCFRAAEILYLHAAARGNVEASLKLGVIYAADLCEGLYWNWEAQAGQECSMGSLPLQAQAFERLSYAAVRGNAEACWQLGDLVMSGRGCVKDPARALALYQRSFDIADQEADVESLGNAALRLGLMFEQGFGCSRDLRKSLAWYRLSLEALDQALEGGAWHYKRARRDASAGVRRMLQEISGRY